MSENTSNQDSSAEPTSRDASLKVDSSSLHGDELDFANMMGFGDEPDDEPEQASADEPAALIDESQEENEVAEPEAIAASGENSEDRTDWEEIHPRPSADSNQGLLQARAREVMSYRDQPRAVQSDSDEESVRDAVAAAPSPLPASSVEDTPSELIAASVAVFPCPPAAPAIAAESVAALAADRAELDALKKEREAISTEFETLNTEHDFLLDHHVALQGQLVRSNEEVERLQASLRAARTTLAPLPEGERALRAEVLGLRDRLEAAHAVNQRLDTQCETAATELAITRARFEDRQHEVDVRLEEITALERALNDASQSARVQAEKQRELLDLSTRLQAENNELRSAQSALEETLQARNLEITAREEHLAVTRDGLLSRDRQIIDLNALLETNRAEVERGETELARRDVEVEQNRLAIDRREVRIASLSETLAKIEKVMGRRGDPLSLQPDLFSAQDATPQTPSSTTALSFDPTPSSTPDLGFEMRTSTDTGAIDEPESENESDLPLPLPLASHEDGFQTDDDEPANSPASAADNAEGLPPERALLTPWRNGCLSEWMGSMGTETLADYFAAHLAQVFSEGWPATLRLKSLGGDQLDAEICLLEALENCGVTEVEMEVCDPYAARAAQRAQRVEATGWTEQIQIRVGSLSDADIEPKPDAILLSDALFGRSDAALELEWCDDALSDAGLLLFADQIQGGALTLSPDMMTRLEEIWAVLPESITLLPGFSDPPTPDEDGGVPEASGPSLETLFGDFISLADVGFGHLADLVIGPTRGASLSEDDPATKRLLCSIFGLDESRSITESLPSRHGVGIFSKSDGSPPSTTPLFAPEWHTSELDEG